MNIIYEEDKFAKKLINEIENGKHKNLIWYGATTYIQTKYGLLVIYLAESNPLDYIRFNYKYVNINKIKEN